MYAFAVSAPLTSVTNSPLASSFTAVPVCTRNPSPTGPTMLLRTSLRRPVKTSDGVFSGFGVVLAKAGAYMASSVQGQYLNKSNPTGVFGVSCTEGSVKFAADAARVRVLGNRFRASQASMSKKSYDLFENRKQAIVAAHNCSHEEKQFTLYPKMTSTYNLARSEALGTCSRYATPETIEEAAMLRYMDVQQGIAANPTGVYNTYCNEGSSKFQSEDIRIATLNAAFRQGQKPLAVVLQEKYNQKQQGYACSNGCNYEEGLVSKYPALGAAFRSKVYGY